MHYLTVIVSILTIIFTVVIYFGTEYMADAYDTSTYSMTNYIEAYYVGCNKKTGLLYWKYTLNDNVYTCIWQHCNNTQLLSTMIIIEYNILNELCVEEYGTEQFQVISDEDKLIAFQLGCGLYAIAIIIVYGVYITWTLMNEISQSKWRPFAHGDCQFDKLL